MMNTKVNASGVEKGICSICVTPCEGVNELLVECKRLLGNPETTAKIQGIANLRRHTANRHDIEALKELASNLFRCNRVRSEFNGGLLLLTDFVLYKIYGGSYSGGMEIVEIQRLRKLEEAIIRNC